MSVVTLTWSIIATVSLTLAAFCVFAWLVERRKVEYLMYCLIAIATATCAPFELGMMHASTLLNLFVNAMDAMESCPAGTKRIFIATRSAPDGGVEVSVSDSGPGIPDHMIERVFHPLFTTKPEGLGLGLALSRTIVDAHGGRLWVDNRAEVRGAVLRMVLPSA